MKKIFTLVISAMLVSSAAFAEETCYQISQKRTSWSKTPEKICLELTAAGTSMAPPEYSITLRTGFSFEEKTVATFNQALTQRVREINVNQDQFGLVNPENSTFNALSIQFNGKTEGGIESGTVLIGKNKFYYRSIKSSVSSSVSSSVD